MISQLQASAPAPKRVTRPSKRQDILLAASKIINEQGLGGLTWASVADRVGLAPTAISYHFRTSEALAAACYQEGIAHVVSMFGSTDDNAPPGERLEQLLGCASNLLRDTRAGRRPAVVELDEMRRLNDTDTNEAYFDLFRRFRRLLYGQGEESKSPLSRDQQNVRAHLGLVLFFASQNILSRFDDECFDIVMSELLLIMRSGLSSKRLPMEIVAAASVQQQRAPEESQQGFLDAATRLMAQHGYRGASVDMISAELDVTKGAFYHQNQDKASLAAKCIEHSFEIIRSGQARAEASGASAAEKLLQVVSELVTNQLERTPLLSPNNMRGVPRAALAPLESAFERILSRVGLVASQGLTDGSLAAVSPYVASEAVLAAIYGASDLPPLRLSVEARDMGRLYVEALFNGLLSPDLTSRLNSSPETP